MFIRNYHLISNIWKGRPDVLPVDEKSYTGEYTEINVIRIKEVNNFYGNFNQCVFYTGYNL